MLSVRRASCVYRFKTNGISDHKYSIFIAVCLTCTQARI